MFYHIPEVLRKIKEIDKEIPVKLMKGPSLSHSLLSRGNMYSSKVSFQVHWSLGPPPGSFPLFVLEVLIFTAYRIQAPGLSQTHYSEAVCLRSVFQKQEAASTLAEHTVK